MSATRDAYVSVRQSQVSAWDSARYAAQRAAQESAALRDQQRRLEQRQQAQAREFSAQLDLQMQAQRRSMNAMENRLDANIRSEIERQSRVEDEKRAALARHIQADIEARDRAVNERVDSVSEAVDALNTRIGEAERRIEQVDADLRGEIRRTSAEIREQMGEIESQLRVIDSERETARQYTQGLINSCEALLADLKEREEDCERFCPTELEALERRYAEARAIMNRGLDPVSGVISLNQTVIAATELRARVIYGRSRFDAMRYDFLGIVAAFEEMSSETYRVPSVQEGYLFTLDEMSRGELAAFRARLADIRARIESGRCTTEDLASIREDLKQLPVIYNGIVDRAVYFESVAEEVRAQSRTLIDRFTASGFRFDGALLRSDQSTMLVFGSRAGEGLTNRIVLEVIPSVKEGKNGTEMGYAYRQRVFVLDENGRFMENYDPACVRSAWETIHAVTGASMPACTHGREGEAGTKEEYADVAAAFSQASGGAQ